MESFETKACPRCLMTKPMDHNFCGGCGAKLVLAEVSIKKEAAHEKAANVKHDIYGPTPLRVMQEN